MCTVSLELPWSPDSFTQRPAQSTACVSDRHPKWQVCTWRGSSPSSYQLWVCFPHSDDGQYFLPSSRPNPSWHPWLTDFYSTTKEEEENPWTFDILLPNSWEALLALCLECSWSPVMWVHSRAPHWSKPGWPLTWMNAGDFEQLSLCWSSTGCSWRSIRTIFASIRFCQPAAFHSA